MRHTLFFFAGLTLFASPVLADASASHLIELDRQFAADAQKLGVAQAFAKYTADTVIGTGNGGGRKWGVPYTREDYAAQFSPGSHLDWVPEDGMATKDVGYNWGHWWSDVKLADGTTKRVTGRYFNVWRKQKDGSWKIVADLGAQDRPPLNPTASKN